MNVSSITSVKDSQIILINYKRLIVFKIESFLGAKVVKTHTHNNYQTSGLHPCQLCEWNDEYPALHTACEQLKYSWALSDITA